MKPGNICSVAGNNSDDSITDISRSRAFHPVLLLDPVFPLSYTLSNNKQGLIKYGNFRATRDRTFKRFPPDSVGEKVLVNPSVSRALLEAPVTLEPSPTVVGNNPCLFTQGANEENPIKTAWTEGNRPASPRDSVLLLLIIALGFLLRVWGANWGFPLLLHVDEPVIAENAYRMASNHSWDPDFYGRPNHVSIYLHALVFQGISYLKFKAPLAASFPQHILFFYLASRLLTALLGTITIGVAYLIGKEYSTRIGLITALLFSLFPAYVVHAHFITPDIPLTLFVSLVILFTVRYIKNPSPPVLMGSGFFSAVATAEKYPGILSCGLIALAILAARPQGPGWTTPRGRMKACGIAILSFGLALALVSPYLLIHYQKVMSSLILESRPRHLGADNLGYLGNMLFYAGTYFNSAGIILSGFSIFGLYWGIRHCPRELMPVLFGLFYFLMLSGLSLHWERWALPMYITPLFLGGVGIHAAWGLAVQKPKKSLVAFVFLSALGLAFVNQFALGLQSSLVFGYPDTRNISLAYCREHRITESETLYDSYTPFAPRGIMDKFLADYRDRTSNPGKRFIIVSSFMYDRFFAEKERYPTQVNAYNEIFSLPLVAEFNPTERIRPEWLEIKNLAALAGAFFRDRPSAPPRVTGPGIKIFRIGG
jgi:4-amino-4-deoxy-L-arabinose transferase-like glycosyltransferase